MWTILIVFMVIAMIAAFSVIAVKLHDAHGESQGGDLANRFRKFF